MTTTSTTRDARDQLVIDLKEVIAGADELLKATSGEAGERIRAARSKAEETLRAARERLANVDDAVMEQAKEAARSADEYVHEHPWGAVGIAAVAGVLLGVLISRR